MILFFFVICQYRKEVRNAYKGGGLVEAMYCLLNITLIYPIFANKKNPIFLYNCCQKWLDNLLISFLFRLYFVQDFLYRLETQSNRQ